VEDDDNNDELEEVDRVTLFDGESGVIDQALTDVKTQLLEPVEWLSQKKSLMEIFDSSRPELDAILKGEGDNGKDFIRIVRMLDTEVWEPVRHHREGCG